MKPDEGERKTRNCNKSRSVWIKRNIRSRDDLIRWIEERTKVPPGVRKRLVAGTNTTCDGTKALEKEVNAEMSQVRREDSTSVSPVMVESIGGTAEV